MRFASILTPLLVAAAILVPDLAVARFLLLDANFDNRTAGTSLQRRGAEFGEPVPGLGDNSSDVVVEDAPGDMSVRISDTTSALSQSDGDLLYFAFSGGRAVGDGMLHASCEFLPESFDVYEFSVRPPDFGPSFFELTLDGAGLVYRLDGDTNNEQMIGLSYVAGVPLELEVVFDLDAGTYDFWFGGVLVLDDEPHGRGVGELVGGLVVGNQSDGNATGSVRVDDLTVSWVPGTANELLVANFNDKPLGQPIQTRGATFGEPTSVTGGVTAIVRGSVTPTPSLEIADDGIDEDDDGLVVFTNRGNVTIDEGSLSVRMTLLFDSIEGWEIRMPGLDLEVHTAGGNLVLYDVSSGFDVEVGRHPYSIGFPYKLEFAFEFDFGQFVWWVADERIGPRQPIPGGATGLRTLEFFMNQDGDLLGRMRVDNFEIHSSEITTSVPQTALAAARLLRATPNPFNPATRLSFELPSDEHVRLTIHDGRGRIVRRLVDGVFSSGLHEVSWRGTDDAGRAVASGVYWARMETSRDSDRVAVVLLK